MNRHVFKIKELFNNNANFHNVHQQLKPILENAVNDKNFLEEVIKQNLKKPSFIARKRHYPTLAMDVYKDNNVDIVVNIFPALPNCDTDISFQSIHHHGNLKLSTIGLSGPGYRSIIFSDMYNIGSGNHADLRIQKEYQNKVGKYTFCDAYVPHVVFYPKAMSSTLVVWSKAGPEGSNAIKNLFPKVLRNKLGSLLNSVGLREMFNINTPQYFDFYPCEKKFYTLKQRIGYPIGSNSNFLQNFFHFLQSVNFNDPEFLEELCFTHKTNQELVKWIQLFLAGEKIEPKFESIHINVDEKVNIKYSDIIDSNNV